MIARTLLVGDVGGTTTRFALYDTGLHTVHQWDTAAEPDLAHAVRRFQSQIDTDPIAACVAVAGPVVGDMARLTNRSWEGRVDDLPVPGRLINDLHAAARGLSLVSEAERVQIGGGTADLSSPYAVMGVGTGLGEAVVADGVVVAGEGGHADFAPADPLQVELLAFLRERHGHVSWERVVSGMAMGALLEFARTRTTLGADALAVLGEMAPAEVVSTFADRDESCALAMDLFVRCCGAEAGNLAVRSLPRGGVFLVGGVAARVLPFLQDGRFRAAFEAKGRMSEQVATIPCFVVTDPHVGLLGAAVEAQALQVE